MGDTPKTPKSRLAETLCGVVTLDVLVPRIRCNVKLFE
jgi:hypothetical protein